MIADHHQPISDPTDLLDQLRARLEEMVRTYDNHTAALQVRIENLEEEKCRLVKEVRTAHELNNKLQRRLESAQDSSTGVARKTYDHALKVIRDLIEDRPLAAGGGEELNQVVVSDLTALEDSDTEESASTARPRRTPPPTQAPNPPSDMEPMHVHFGADNLPSFATETHCRFFKWAKWVKILNLDADTEETIESLALANDLNPRIHGTTEGLLFVYHPIFLEFPSEGQVSYFIDWSSKEVNQRIQQYLCERESDEKPLHVFVWPQSKKSWYYVGAHRISVMDTRDTRIWARLNNSDRPIVARHIAERCNYDESQVSQALNSEELDEVLLAVHPEEEETKDLLSRLPEKKKAK
ncbi:uncharacterized protein EV420DRAFT_1635385 [Desarmillaria tabescens]|uniref:Uncharacterized protein n=1 Tax=Armillaria tabescens TaxID=1929756 RepID=A0AA39NMH2_ARMTA|nr:uncharacterized protein EV420DRAFT_1635385 [Desarmillaria tabescens]KAK0468128.1 hypothetical protein EV420DRAFT_1635385 [Desarmillaria tabescens]